MIFSTHAKASSFFNAYEIIINNSNDPQVLHLIINMLQTMLLIYTVESQHSCYFSMRKGNKMVMNIICGLESFFESHSAAEWENQGQFATCPVQADLYQYHSNCICHHTKLEFTHSLTNR